LTVEAHVPDWIFDQVLAVSREARRDGINLALESRQFLWVASSVYYPPGTSEQPVPRVGVFAHPETPPTKPDGNPESIRLGWDATRDPDGDHDDLTYVQGKVWLQAVDGDPVVARRAIRYLIALTQGIDHTTRTDSGITTGTRIDRFTGPDVAAMTLMSGCDATATQFVVRHHAVEPQANARR
jgi:hypothetical protein